MRVDQSISTTVNLSDADGTSSATPSFQWFANNAAISGQRADTVQLSDSFAGQSIFVEVTFEDDAGFTEIVRSDSFDLGEKFRLTQIADNSGSWNYSMSLDYGATWQSPIDIGVSDPVNEETYEIDVATDGQGNLVAVAYSESSNIYGDNPIVFTYSHDNGDTWSTSDRIAASGNDYYVGVEYDGIGTWIAVWSTTEPFHSSGTDRDIVFSTSTDIGVTWSAPALVNSFATTDSNANNDSQLAFSAQGDNWFVAWRSDYDLNGEIGTDSDVLYATTSNGGQSWADAAVMNSDAATDFVATNSNDYFPVVDIAPNGFGVVTWAGSDASDLDIYAAITNDYGVTWTNETMINTYGEIDSDGAPFDGDYPQSVTVTTEGTAVITWEGTYTSLYGADSEPLYAVTTDSGATWSDTRSMKAGIESDSSYENYPEIIENPNGGWIGFWADGDIWITTSEDLETWSTPFKNGLYSGDPAGWVFH